MFQCQRLLARANPLLRGVSRYAAAAALRAGTRSAVRSQISVPAQPHRVVPVVVPRIQVQVRHFASAAGMDEEQAREQGDKTENVLPPGAEGIPFAISPDGVVYAYSQWSWKHIPWRSPYPIKAITPILAPFWVFEFDVTVRSKKFGVNRTISYHNRTVPSPSSESGARWRAAQVYAGANYAPELLDSLKVPATFGRAWDGSVMLRIPSYTPGNVFTNPIQDVNNRGPAKTPPQGVGSIEIDTFITPEAEAWEMVKDQVTLVENIILRANVQKKDSASTDYGGSFIFDVRDNPRDQSLKRIEALVDIADPGDVEVTFDNVVSRRLYVPGYIVTYERFFATFKVFVNGVTARTFGYPQRSFLPDLQKLFVLLQIKISPQMVKALGRLLFYPPVAIALLSWRLYNVFKGYILQFFYEFRAKRRASQYSAKPQPQRQAWNFRRSERAESRSSKLGEEAWGKFWQESGYSSSSSYSSSGYSRERTSGSSSYSRTSSSSSSSSFTDAETERLRHMGKAPEPIPSDVYELLGLPRPRTRSEAEKIDLKTLSQAFRKQLMMYHPDTYNEQTAKWSKAYATRRTAAIIEGYAKVKTAAAKSRYDMQYPIR